MLQTTFDTPQYYTPPEDNLLDNVDLRLLYPGAHGACVMVRCPWHEDKDTGTPNLAVYPRNVICYKCGMHAGALDFVKLYLGYSLSAKGYPKAVFDKLAEIQSDKSTAKPSDDISSPLPMDDRVVAVYERRLIANQEEPVMDFLTGHYGLKPETIEAARIGLTGRAIAIPVIGLDMRLYNIRFRILPEYEKPDESKYWGVSGHNHYPWYFTPSLIAHGYQIQDATLHEAVYAAYGKEAVIVTEGEMDALALYQLGFPAISATNGALSLAAKRADLLGEMFAGLTVYLMYDQDEAGDYASSVIHNHLRELGIRTYNLTWDPDWGKDASELVAQGAEHTNIAQIILSTIADEDALDKAA